MGHLYKHSNAKKNAIASYKEALRKMPTSIEIIECLVSTGVDAFDITTLIDEAIRAGSSKSLYEANFGWTHTLVQVIISLL